MPNTPPNTEIDALVKVSPPQFNAPLRTMSNSKDISEMTPTNDLSPVEDDKRGIKEKVKVEDVDVQRMVEETVKRVREQSDKIQSAAKPYADKTRVFAEGRPVLFTFLAIFTVLSIIPLCLFAGFVISSSIFILTVAAIGICLSILFTILIASSILLPTLFVTSLISISILSFLLTLFLLHRLYLNLQASTSAQNGNGADYANLSRGVRAWVHETAERVPGVPFDISSLRIGPLGHTQSTLSAGGAAGVPNGHLDEKIKIEPIENGVKVELNSK